jgi:hypothetical protein
MIVPEKWYADEVISHFAEVGSAFVNQLGPDD